MSTAAILQNTTALDMLEVQLLSEEEIANITGGAGPIAIGCLMAAGGVGVLAVGVVIGVAVFLIMN